MSLPPGGFPPGYEWDEDKNQANIRKHGIDFRDAVRVFNKPTLDRVDDRQDYGEIRMNSFGDLDGRVVVMVTHTDREEITRLISARTANSAERTAYQTFERGLADVKGPSLTSTIFDALRRPEADTPAPWAVATIGIADRIRAFEQIEADKQSKPTAPKADPEPEQSPRPSSGPKP